MTPRLERALQAVARLATRPATFIVWGAFLASAALVGAAVHPPARWWMLASTGATMVTFAMYVAFVSRNRRMNAARARTATFERTLAETETRASRLKRIRRDALDDEFSDEFAAATRARRDRPH